MAWSTGTVSIGGSTKQSDYQRLLDDIIEIASNTFSFGGAKIFTSTVTVIGAATFSSTINVGGVATFQDAIAVTDSATLSGGLNTGDVTLKVKIVNIGDWDMDATNSVNVAHGLTWSDIRHVNVLVRTDANDEALPLNYNPGTAAGRIRINATNVVCYRTVGGEFDNASYDSTSYNRGWVFIWYLA